MLTLLTLQGLGCTGDADPPRFAEDTDTMVRTRHFADDPVVGAAVAVGDLNGDGRADLLVGGGQGPMGVYLGREGLRFEEADLGLGEVVASAIGIADLDGDGAVEVVTGSDGDGVRIHRWTGDRFASGDATPIEQPVHVLFADLDGDGRVDVHVSSYGGRNVVLQALPDGTFVDRAEPWGLAQERFTWSATWFDHDDDGDPDLYLTTDTFEEDLGERDEGAPGEGLGDLLFRNDGATADGTPVFVEIASEVGLDTPRSSMGGLPADLDGDGRIELFISDFGRNHAVRFDGTRYRYETATLGVGGFLRDDIAGCPEATTREGSDRCALVSWAAFHEDVEGDGVRELLVINGGIESDDRGRQPVSLWERSESAMDARTNALPSMEGRAAAMADLDGDGDADLVVTERAELPRVFENLAPQRPWATIRLTDRRGAGATVRANGRVHVLAPGGRAQTHLPGELRWPEPTTAEIRWPNGVTESVRVDGLTEVAPPE